MPEVRRPGNGKFLTVQGAAENNLKEITVRFPLRKFIAVTGVSGSGKSSLVVEVLYKRLNQFFYRAKAKPGKHDVILGLDLIDKVVNIDQSPIGRTPRSNPATYTNIFTHIRELFARLPEAKARGYKPGRFSFNVKGGRCEACRGDGIIKIEMQFLPDVYVPCEVCHGRRYNREALEIRYKGRNIAEVLDMTVEEALAFFSNVPRIRNKLQTLSDVGLGYIRLGQPATTLSGGEAQRIKLSKELSRRATGRTFYILDEPTTGLHFADIEKLLQVLHRLVDQGNTVVVIEHNLDVIKAADWIIDLGPEGGDGGGWIVAEGTPEEVSRVRKSYTGQYLQKILERRKPEAEGAMSQKTRISISLIASLAVLVLLIGLTIVSPPDPETLLPAALFCVLIIFTTTFGVPLAGGRGSLLPMTTAAAFLVLGTVPTAWAAFVGAMVHGAIRYQWADRLQERSNPSLVEAMGLGAANAAIQTFSILVGGFVYYGTGGVTPLTHVHWSDMPSLVISGLTYLVANLFIAGLVVCRTGQEGPETLSAVDIQRGAL